MSLRGHRVDEDTDGDEPNTAFDALPVPRKQASARNSRFVDYILRRCRVVDPKNTAMRLVAEETGTDGQTLLTFAGLQGIADPDRILGLRSRWKVLKGMAAITTGSAGEGMRLVVSFPQQRMRWAQWLRVYAFAERLVLLAALTLLLYWLVRPPATTLFRKYCLPLTMDMAAYQANYIAVVLCDSVGIALGPGAFQH